MTEEQIKHMVTRFLTWRLPETFSPDGGISFEKHYNQHTQWPGEHEPVGTNLLSAMEADAMVRHMIEGMPPVGEASDDQHTCPVCADPFKGDDECASDIELGICHAACLKGSPTVDLDTGEPVDGPMDTYHYNEFEDALKAVTPLIASQVEAATIERCAKVAEGVPEQYLINKGESEMRERIATAIRSLSEGEKG